MIRFEKLGRWDEALTAYENKQLEDPLNYEVTLGRMRYSQVPFLETPNT